METDHARDNAKAWAGTIAELVAALECDYDRLEELRDERQLLVDETAEAENHEIALAHITAWDNDHGEELAELTEAATIDGELQTDADSARQTIQEEPLSVEVRSGWHTPDDAPDDWEFMILLSTGGPAARIRGELDQYREPCRAWLEYQDWGTPWTEYHGDGCEHETLLTFCQQFYFGE